MARFDIVTKTHYMVDGTEVEENEWWRAIADATGQQIARTPIRQRENNPGTQTFSFYPRPEPIGEEVAERIAEEIRWRGDFGR